MIKSDSISKLATALIAAQKEFAPVLKTQENPFFKRGGKPSKYADLAAAIDATQTALQNNELVVSQFPISADGRVGVLTLLIHASGEYIGKEFTLPLAKQDAQTGVAAVTYSRRTAYLGVLGIAAEDDDGNTAAGRDEEYEEPAPEPLPRRRRAAPDPEFDVTEHTTVRYSRPPAAEIPSEPLPEPENDPTLAEVFNETPESEIPEAGGPLPTDKELDSHRLKMGELAEDLEHTGGLKASRGMPIKRKVLQYLLQSTGVDDATKVSAAQWDAFFQYTDKLLALENGPALLANLVNGGKA